MKKQLTALFLALCLLFSLMAAASAETLYLTLQSMLNDEASGDNYLGKGYYQTDENTSKVVVLYYNEPQKFVVLRGYNSEDAAELSYWTDVETVKGVYTIYTLCKAWETVQARADEGYQVVLGYVYGDGENDVLTVGDAPGAEAFCNTIESLGTEAPAETTTETAAE